MTNQLVDVSNGRVTFGAAVARVADSLSPLGAIARVVAESSACVVAIQEIHARQEIQLAGQRVEADTTVRLAELENRRRAASASLRQMRHHGGQADLTAKDLRRCVVNMQREVVKPRITSAEMKTYVELIRVFTTTL